MSNQRNIYDFSYPSPSTESGFVLFKREDTKSYYFHINDKDGEVLLFSERYSTLEGRNNGVQSVSKNINTKSRYKTIEEDGGFYFVLRAGNYREIGRSRKFKTLNEIENYINWLSTQNIDSSSENIDEIKVEKVKPNPKSKKGKSKLSNPLKYNFRIELYPRQGDESIKGRIENVLTGKKKTFTGLDEKLIFGFIINNLNNDDKIFATRNLENQSDSSSKSAKKSSQEQISINQNNLNSMQNMDLVLVNDKTSTPRKNWQFNDSFEIQLQIKDNAQLDWEIGEKILLEIKVEPIQSSKFSTQWIVEVPYTGGRAINLPNYSIPLPGLYHLKARTKNKSRQQKLTGGTVVNIY